MLPFSIGHGVTMIPNIHSLTKYCERYLWGRYTYIYILLESACKQIATPVDDLDVDVLPRFLYKPAEITYFCSQYCTSLVC